MAPKAVDFVVDHVVILVGNVVGVALLVVIGHIIFSWGQYQSEAPECLL